MFNDLHQDPRYKIFYMNPNGSVVNHIVFVDDAILCYNEDKGSIKLVIDTLTEYENTSEQVMNKEKSCFAWLTRQS